MVGKVLVANRGAIAVRIFRTLKQMGIASVAVFSEEDRSSMHVDCADEAYCLGGGPARDTYLDQGKLLDIASRSGAAAIHPGYGFLSENPGFVERCEAEGIVFLGPAAEQMKVFGLKHTARDVASAAKVPLLPGSGLMDSLQEAIDMAEAIGYPVMLKSTAGGGGIGMQVCNSSQELEEAWDSVRRLGENNFSNSGVFVEKYIRHARHIEVQVFGDGKGKVIALGERDCSTQRRNQKVIEEAPAPGLDSKTRQHLHETAVRLAAEVKYRSAGTVEFILDQDSGDFYFLEVNTRLQVEHGVTEAIYDEDIVRWMVELGAGDMQQLPGVPQANGHAIQARVYAEDPQKNFQPSAGLLTDVSFPEANGLRIDTWVQSGVEVSPFFDPMLAKVIVHKPSREEAIASLAQALENSSLYGIETNRNYLVEVLQTKAFADGAVHTRFLEDFSYHSSTLEVLSGGTMTTVQDYPGRMGYWDVGVPPSGPFDNLSLRLANQLLGNSPGTPGLEFTLNGPGLRFNTDTLIALAGAAMDVKLDDEPLPFWKPVPVRKGQVLKAGKINGPGARTYMAVAGGIHCPEYLGSCSTFTLGQFGGHAGRALQAGDVLHVESYPEEKRVDAETCINENGRPVFSHEWNIRVTSGPHGAPDFFTENDIETFFSCQWEVHYNSSRTGIRLIGPKPEWARSDGGEAGMHPSNIHDNAYAIGTVDFTGDMPVILGPDGPSLGGFVCPATVIQADLWKLGQLRAGDKIRFVPVSVDEAVRAGSKLEESIESLHFVEEPLAAPADMSPVIQQTAEGSGTATITYRSAGDNYLLVEFGELKLDIELRFRAHALMLWLRENPLEGIVDLTPGIRSLQVHYNSLVLPRHKLLGHLERAWDSMGDIEAMEVPTRTVHLPLSWNDEACQIAVSKYMQSVRKDAPWCPDNIEFIRRINGLDSVDDVKRIVFDASYLVMGLGDVYLGAPVATPLDPRHRLVTTKYNPARTWTAENSVGIGGSYLCIYGMEGPGGYQFVGRTLQVWNRYRTTKEFDKPWLLEFFDQVRFYEAGAEEVLEMRKDFPLGRCSIDIEESTFSLRQYRKFLEENRSSIAAFTSHREKAFAEELQRWVESGQINFSVEEDMDELAGNDELADGEVAIESSVSGSVWQISVKEGEWVREGDELMVIESMKMEIPVHATHDGLVKRILREAGKSVSAGQAVMVVEEGRTEKAMNETLGQLPSMQMQELRKDYLEGRLTPGEVVDAIYKVLPLCEEHNIWITLLDREQVQLYVDRLEGKSPEELPLYGIPFAIKDNIDLAGVPTTAACEAYTRVPEKSATVVRHLLEAGAIPLGKTNMDQFATGLVGTRSPEPWGACKNAFDKAYISGGSSSGSAVAVALGLVSFALGTDTAGSGRVPAAFNNIIGLKPTRGIVSAAGVVPACRSLDCVSVFALTSSDASAVLDVIARPDEQDDFSRDDIEARFNTGFGKPGRRPSIGVIPVSGLEVFGDEESRTLYGEQVLRIKEQGWQVTEIDFTPFAEAASLLYEGPWVAERYLATSDYLDDMLEVTREIIGSGNCGSTADAFRAMYQLQALKKQADRIFAGIDAVMTPTAARHFTLDQVAEEPVKYNSQLGYYTNFMNLLDYSAVAVPAAFRDNGLPFGITLFAPAFSDQWLLSLAHEMEALTGIASGVLPGRETARHELEKVALDGRVKVAVCGAHLQGQPLNWQLLQRQGRLEETTTTAPCYRFYALAGGPPFRPGLVKDEQGEAIIVEVWSLPFSLFGSFVAGIPAPLGIGKVELADGREVPGFICEPRGIEGAEDITPMKDWREYIRLKNS